MRKRFLVQVLTFFCVGIGWKSYAQNSPLVLDYVLSPSSLGLFRDYEDASEIRLKEGCVVSPYSYGNSGSNGIRLLINRDLIQNANYSSNGVNQSNVPVSPIDYSLPVGAIIGSSEVSLTGQATYQIPILLPPGINGLTPELSIIYNSGLKSGVLGRGWNIAGLSAISRTNKDLYHDGITISPYYFKNIKLDTYNSAYALDGIRILGSLTSGARLELDNFSKITWGAAVGDYFLLETKDGLIMQFGNSADSKQLLIDPATNQNVTVKWYLTKVSDQFGNYILYNYYNRNSEVQIKEIIYGLNSGIQSTNSINVKFYYSEKADYSHKYFQSNLLEERLLLKEVEIRTHGNFTKGYKFNYGFDKETFLNEIIEVGSDYKKFNSTIIGYGLPSSSALTITRPLTSGNDILKIADYLAGDYNGDGKTDLVAFEYSSISPDNGSRTYTGNWKLYLNENDGSTFSEIALPTTGINSLPSLFNPYATSDFIPELAQQPYGNSWSWTTSNPSAQSKIEYADFNLDGLDDILIVNTITGQTYYTVYYSNGSGFEADLSNRLITNMNNQTILGDLDADGIPEAITYMSGTSSFPGFSIHSFKTGSSFFIPSTALYDEQGALLNVNQVYQGFRILDFDGDGVVEIQTTRLNKFRVLKFNIQVFRSDEIYSEDINATYIQNYYIDLNGDGISDNVKISNPNNSAAFPFVRLGNGLDAYSNIDPLQGTGSFGEWRKHLFLDVNRDGYADFINLIKSSSGINVDVSYGGHENFQSTNLGLVSNVNYPPVVDYNFEKYVHYPTIVVHNTNVDQEPEFLLGDFNGDGQQDIFFKTTDSGRRSILYINKDAKNYLATRVVDGLRNEVDFEYFTLANNGEQVYTKANGSVHPLVDIQSNYLDVVRKHSVTDGVGGMRVFEYSYEGAISHLKGKGFLGFNKISIKDIVGNSKVEKSFGLDPIYFDRYHLATKKYLLTDLINPIFEETSSSTFIPTGTSTILANSHYSVVDNISSHDIVTGKIITNINTYDDGNLIKNIATINNTDITETNFSYIHAGCWGTVKNKLESVITNIRLNGEPSYIRSTNYNYNSGNGALLSTIQDPGTSNEVITNLGYNAISGVLTSRNIAATNCTTCPPKSFIYEYDEAHRFITNETNPLGQVTEYVNDQNWGLPLSIKGIDGLVTKKFYDGFGRLSLSISPSNIVTKTIVEWIQSPLSMTHLSIASYPCYKTTFSSTGRPNCSLYIDKLGRTVMTEKDGFTNKIFNETQYDEHGNIVSTTSNYAASSFPVITTYTYNDIRGPNLLTGVRSSDNFSHTNISIISYAFSLGNTTVTTTAPDGSSSSKTMNSAGRLTFSSDPGGILSYFYNSNGKYKEIKLDGVTVNSMTYDNFANQTSLFDKNARTTSYSYDAYGQLISQIDAKGNKYDGFQYNAIGKMERKVENSTGVYTYHYCPSGSYGVNKIQTVSGPNGIVDSYEYDQFSRLIKYAEIGVPGQSQLTTNYNYDEFGNLSSTIYPGNLKISQEYNSKGNVVKITNSGATLWELNEISAYGNYTKYTLGNGVQTEVKYDNFGYLEEKISPTIQYIKTDFNLDNGNLTSRTDLLKNITEQFGYDQLKLNRLVSSQVGINTTTVTYDTDGTILDKTDAGTYSAFDPNHLSAVATISGINNSSLPHLDQTITYTPFNSIQNVTEGNYFLDFTYGPNQERRMTTLMDYPGLNIISKKIFYPNYEKLITGNDEYEVYYINAPSGLCALYVVKNGGQGEFYYVYSDHLGSILSLTDASGNLIAEQSFDPWGRKRDPSNWDDYTSIPSVPDWLWRGFTGHEHLDEFGLINMNGRCYDPILGSLISPDNFNKISGSTQNYNRYTYALNNPLKYTDQNGEWIHIVIGAAIGGIVNLGIKAYQGKINNFGDGLAAFGIGAVAGAFGAATGGAAFTAAGGAAGGVGGFAAGAAGGAVGAAVATPIQSIGNSAYFGDPMISGNQLLLSVGIGALTGGVINGSIALSNGRSFFTGAAQSSQSGTQAGASVNSSLNENNKSLDIARQEINQAIPENGPINYKTDYYTKVDGPDGIHNWNRTTIEIVADNGKVFPNSIGLDGKPQILIQAPGNRFGIDGVYDMIIRDGVITHQAFVPGGVVSGVTNSLNGVSPPSIWWQVAPSSTNNVYGDEFWRSIFLVK